MIERKGNERGDEERKRGREKEKDGKIMYQKSRKRKLEKGRGKIKG